VKFTDGNWMLRKGVRVFYPSQVYSMGELADGLSFLASREVRHRGDTLDGPLLTLNLTSPMDGVIRVGIRHLTGGLDRGPHFPVSIQSRGHTSLT